MAEQSPNDLISRSQAKRLLLRIDRFRTVVLDFQNVNQIGQAFADEIFRVFVRSHPGVDVQFTKANEEVVDDSTSAVCLKMVVRSRTERIWPDGKIRLVIKGRRGRTSRSHSRGKRGQMFYAVTILTTAA
jgi:hypothetical protein